MSALSTITDFAWRRLGAALPHSARFARESVLPLWRWYLAGTAAVLLTNWLSVEVPSLMASALDKLRAGQPGAGRDAAWIAAIGLGVIVVRTLSRVWFFTPGRLAETQLRERFFTHLLRLQPGFYARYPTGDLLSRATADVTYARALAGFALLQACNVVGALGFGTWKMLTMSPILTLAVAAPCVLAFTGMSFATRRLMALQRITQKQLGLLADELLSTFQGVATVQAFCAEATFADRLDGRAGDLRASNLEMARIRALAFPLLSIAGGAATWGLLAFGGSAVNAGTLSPGQLAAFIALVGYIVMPMRMLGWLLPVFQRAEASLERIHLVLDEPEDRPDGASPLPAPTTAPSIELRHLSFRSRLTDVSATLPAGATVGVYGPVGSGKSTLLRVLARLENPPPGTVFVNGVDVLHLDLDAWRASVCVVTQAPFLFSETIEENIGFGATREAVSAAAAAAALGPDLDALPDGLDTVVGERGISLSGGQRQRVALARGLLRPATVVLLDDVLSAVDHHTEQELLATLRARPDATRVIVSHRLSALVHTDLILVLDEGRLVDQGPHAALVQRPGPYRDAWEAQAAAFAAGAGQAEATA
ncbi:ABC transporter ATP-binding protein [Deltaproteobacteria bacterium]|nr:ABC transporter ATP-binding protein [Deltaproteobacteria bacterium]